MEEILIVKTSATTYGNGVTDITDLNSLVEGSLAVLDKSGNLVSATVPSVTDATVSFFVGRASGEGSKKSTPVDRITLDYEKHAYTAPVAQVSSLGATVAGATLLDLNIPASPVADTEASVVIEVVDTPWYQNDRRERFTYQVKSGDAVTDVMNGLVAVINNTATGSNIVTAAAVTTATPSYGITLTAKTAGVGFTFAPNGIIETADVVYAALREADNSNTGVAAVINDTFYSASTSVTLATISGTATLTGARTNVKGSGTYAQALALYNMATAEDGNTDTYRPIDSFTVTSPLETTATYTIYTLRWQSPRRNNAHNPSNPDLKTLHVLVPSANTNIVTAMDTILAGI